MNDKEVIAEEALLVVTDEVGLQHLLAVLRARRDERHGRGVAGRLRRCATPSRPREPSTDRRLTRGAEIPEILRARDPLDLESEDLSCAELHVSMRP